MEFDRSISRKQYGAGDLTTLIKPQFLGILRGNTEDSDQAEAKMSWLRSQLIGDDVEFDTPFGKRFMTYADHTASGRSLRYVEDHIVTAPIVSFLIFPGAGGVRNRAAGGGQISQVYKNENVSDLSLSADVGTGSALMSPTAAKVGGWSFDRELKANSTPTTNDSSNNRFVSYMEAAKGIARLLPESPTPRRIPDDVDLNLVLFWV